MRRIFYILFFLLVNVKFGYAVNDTVSVVNQKQWLENAKKYQYRENFKELKSKENKTHKASRPLFSDLKKIRKILIWSVIIILACVLLYLVTGIFKDMNLRVKENANINSHVIENIETAELDLMLLQFVNNKEYKNAVRYKYLILLRLLNERKFISWKKDKTNGNYITELADQPFFELFRYITIRFEYFWYGENSVEGSDYHNFLPLFEKMDNLVNNHE